MTYKWCEEWTEPNTNYSVCLKWVCFCGHSFEEHTPTSYACKLCSCRKEKFYNNDGCEIFCIFNRKLFELGINK